MGAIGSILKHPEDLLPLVKLKLAVRQIEKQIPTEPHWAFSYTMLQKVSRSFAIVIQQLKPDLRNAVCIFYLVLRGLDTVEDDTSIPTDIKLPILHSFHRHIYDPEWHFSCGTKDYKVLMDKFHHVSTAFLELDKGYQEAVEDITSRMGAGMAKFICKEKTNIIRDYLEDINEIPKSRMFWPRQIWSKYADKLEDLKDEEASSKAVECLNDIVTDALRHADDCLKYMSDLQELSIFRFCAIPQIMAIGTLALCYNNIEIFRGVVKLRRGVVAQVIDNTKTMPDVYNAFFGFSNLLKSKVDRSDPNASFTLERVESIQKTCLDSGTLDTTRQCYTYESNSKSSMILMIILVLLLPILFGFLLAYHL